MFKKQKYRQILPLICFLTFSEKEARQTFCRWFKQNCYPPPPPMVESLKKNKKKTIMSVNSLKKEMK